MTDRGRSPVDASFACPFVAYEDDRDARSDAPDPRHRCFAELRPAPRAIAHQQAYCLSSGFATCPTFVDWAQRESARIRPSDRTSHRDAGLAAGAAFGAEEAAGHDLRSEALDEPVWPRRQEREWAAPPPWGAEHGAAGDEERAAEERAGERTADEPGPADEEAAPPPFLGEREPSDRGRERRSDRADRAAAGAAGASLAAGAFAADAHGAGAPGYEDVDTEEGPAEAPMRRFTPDARRGDRRGDRRAAERASAEVGGPSWETPRRFEAYPTLRPPRSMRSLSPVLLAVAVLVLAALVLFFVPPLLLGLGGSSQSTPTPSPSASASAGAASPTAGAASPSAATASGAATTYVVKSGDTMSRIANKFGVPLDQLIAANKSTIKDPNKLAIGDTLVIPTPVPSEISGASPSPS